MLWTIIIILLILWLLGAFGGRVFSGFPKTGKMGSHPHCCRGHSNCSETAWDDLIQLGFIAK